MKFGRFRPITLFTIFSVVCLSAALLPIIGTISKTQTAHAANPGPALTVDAAAARHAINPGIYGLNSYSQDLASQPLLQPTIVRWGGDSTSNYNWLQDSGNAGSDWYFMGGNGLATPTPGGQVDTIVSNNQKYNAQSLVTLPLLGHVNISSQWNCSFPSSLYPNQQSWNPYVKLSNGDSCGNGKDTNGNNLTDNDLSRNYIPVDQSWVQKWVQHLIDTHGTAAANGVQIYQMDNEPENWNIVPYDIHPGPAGFDEVLNLTKTYAAMVKNTDPTAQILGPGDGYAYSYFHLKDLAGDDAKSHGMDWIPYYLQQLNANQLQNGVRLLNYLDVHYYGNQSDNTENAAANTTRLESTRALWDPTYTVGGNIPGQYATPPQQIGMISLLKAWTNKYYPGTKTSISEYSFGDIAGINGALAEADVLGIFGREGLDSAELWGPPKATDPGAFAFHAYLNFDGKGSQYGDTSVQASSADQGQLSVYGAQRSRDNALTLQVINKTGTDLTSALALNHFNADSAAQVYNYSGANLTGIVPQANVAVSGNSFTTTYPANSITTIVIPQQGSAYVGGSAANPAPSLKNTLQPDVSAYYLSPGQTYQTVVTRIDGNGVGTPITSGVSFSSDNTAVASVASNGLVTATGGGIAHITGSYQGQSFTVTVTGLSLQTIKTDAAYTLPLGAQHQTIITALNSDGSNTPVDATKATYSSDNTAVASVSASGVVTAMAAGTATITSSYNGLSATTIVTVPVSQPLPGGWQQTDIGSVTTAGAVAYTDGIYNVSGAGADVWGNQDQSHFVYQALPADGSLVTRLTSVGNVNPYAKGGLMLRDSLSPGGNIAYLAMFPNGGAQFGGGNANVGSGITGYWGQDSSSAKQPYWLKLDRSDNVVTASVSPDGKSWTQAQQITFPMGQAYIGLFSTAHGAPLMNTTTLDNVSLNNGTASIPPVSGTLPDGWGTADIGSVGGPGHAGYQNGTFTLQATGQNVIGGSDSAYFVYHSLPGDGSITTRVATQGKSNDYAEAGVMLRDGLQAGANVAFLGISPNANTRFYAGNTAAANGIASIWQCACVNSAPYWLRITRAGGTLTAYTSPDGTTWTQQAQTSFPTGTISIGLAEDATSNILLNTSTFDNVTLTGVETGVANGRYTLTNRNSGLVLDDAGFGGAGTHLIQWSANGGSNQQWTITAVDSNYYKIITGSNLAISIDGGSTAQGADAVLQPYTGSDDQLWQIIATDSGYYQIRNKKSGDVLDVIAVSKDQGAAIHQWPYVNGANQQWRLTAA